MEIRLRVSTASEKLMMMMMMMMRMAVTARRESICFGFSCGELLFRTMQIVSSNDSGLFFL
jgi:hypothetical protein